MGSAQSARATHFQRPEEFGSDPDPTKDHSTRSEEHHISISNKIVERLVEDATLAGGAAAAREKEIPRDDLQDKTHHEKLRNLDELHSERHGLTEEEIKAMVARLEIRTVQMVSADPVCGDCRLNVIECYQQQGEYSETKCHNCVEEFSRCVEQRTAQRLVSQAGRAARAAARRDRHLALARDHALRDLSTPPTYPHT